MTSPSDHLLLRAIRGEAVERPPVWAMRQAGRWDPEFNKLRGKLSFYEFSENPELAAQASLLPRRFGVDAIILFYDITSLAVAMGLPFQFIPGQGPMPAKPIRSVTDVEKLANSFDRDRCRHIFRILDLVRNELAGALPILVFAGAPFTLASYCIGAGKDLAATRRYAKEQSDAWYRLLPRLAIVTHEFLAALGDAGANACQLFDSWAGQLTQDEYRLWCHDWHDIIFACVHGLSSILFVKECPHLQMMTRSGAHVISLGARDDLAAARRQYPDLCFQGNVDQAVLKSGTAEQVYAATRRCVEEGGGRRHIVNLNHGVDPATPVENFEAYVRAVTG